jgi:retron-type reverse transcriptase
MNKKKENIADKRARLLEWYKNVDFKKFKTIEKIAVKSGSRDDAVFDNFMKLVSDPGILYQAMGNISNKKGALTPGAPTDLRTADATSARTITELAEKLKNGTFRFNPIRRIYMDKSGKNPVTKEQFDKLEELHKLGKVTMAQIKELKARPLGISSFPDKIVQEAIRIILNAIYDPEFAKINMNFGFRPGMGCQDAIHQIQQKAKAMDIVIEGDIKGAFDNVNHDIMIEILSEKIKDDKFLKLIRSGLKCGVIFLGYRQDSELGTTQGSVVSPLLYNIYFHQFDKYINYEFRKSIENINKNEHRRGSPTNKLWESFAHLKGKLQMTKKINNLKILYEELGGDNDIVRNLASELKEIKKKVKALNREQRKYKSYAKSRQTVRFWYTRYADDWIFLINASYEIVEQWKKMFSDWIRDNLKLTLSEEKTKITRINIGERAKFLGFSISRSIRPRIKLINAFKTIKKDIVDGNKKVKERVEGKTIFMKRTVNTNVTVTWDRERVINRLIDNGFVKRKGPGFISRKKNSWSVLAEPEIIDRYNYMIRGYINYYAPIIDHPVNLSLIFYLLKYSCAHTLAQKGNTTLTKIFTKFSKDIVINYNKETMNFDRKIKQNVINIVQEKKCLLTWDECKNIMREILYETRKKQKGRSHDSISIIKCSVDEISNVKVNWRTKYKLSQHCAICGSEENVEYHHVKHIRVGKTTGFLQLMNQLNRKQIPCCKKCHINIHRGVYDGMKLSDLYDEELIVL